ncbi:MAG TPA: hypothetical protein VMV60_15900 [Thermoanaerobaculia bacterium]|nr:hypothetical protein [Thermoanaerobaculia bacterium]
MKQLGSVVLVLLAAATLSASAGAPPKAAAGAAGSEQAKVYAAWVKAVKAGDLAAWKKLVPAEASQQIEAQAKEMKKTPKDVVEFLGMMTPDENTVTGLKVDGTKATLSVTGKTKGEPKPSYGKVEMIQEGGAWKVGKQSWSDKAE